MPSKRNVRFPRWDLWHNTIFPWMNPLPPSLGQNILKMKAQNTSETKVILYQNTQRHIPKESNIHNLARPRNEPCAWCRWRISRDCVWYGVDIATKDWRKLLGVRVEDRSVGVEWPSVGVSLYLVGKQDVTMCGEGEELRNGTKKNPERYIRGSLTLSTGGYLLDPQDTERQLISITRHDIW